MHLQKSASFCITFRYAAVWDPSPESAKKTDVGSRLATPLAPPWSKAGGSRDAMEAYQAPMESVSDKGALPRRKFMLTAVEQIFYSL